MTRGLGVGLVTVTPWVVGVVLGWAMGFPMLVVTVTLRPAGDLGGWAVGEDRNGLVDVFGSPEPPESALTWLNGFLGAGAGAEVEGFSLLGVVRVTTRTPEAVGLVRNRFLGRAATTGWVCPGLVTPEGWVCTGLVTPEGWVRTGLVTPEGSGIMVVGLLDGELMKNAWRDVGVTVVLGLAPAPLGELLGKSIMVSTGLFLAGDGGLGEVGLPGGVVGVISV